MRIAIDARELGGRRTGVGRYLSEILTAWNGIPSAQAHEFVLCTPDTVNLPPIPRLRVSSATRAGRGTLWEQFALPALVRNAAADVLFAPGYTAPLFVRVPVAVAIHDVSFAAHPEWFASQEGLRRRLLTRLAAKRACRVLTISEFSKREIVEHLGIDAGKIEVIYPGVTRFTPAAHPEGPPHKQSQNGSLILYVGSVFNRRHIPELLEGFVRLARRHSEVRLEVVGDNRTRPHIDLDSLVRANPMSDRIRVRAYVSDEDLGVLYRTARAFAFLSEYEGFGMTPLDAVAAGIPIVVLDTPVAREIYGAAAIYIERPQPQLIEDALERALFETGERDQLLTASAPVLARYSWEACARQLLDILISCAS
jgi:glycosyltransferase involved in cell wall biosynthesis